MIKKYHDFIIVAEEFDKNPPPGTVQGFTVSVFNSPVGQGEKKTRVEIKPELTKLLSKLARRSLDKRAAHQIQAGKMLANLLLPSYPPELFKQNLRQLPDDEASASSPRELFKQSLRRLPDDEGLRLRLRLADELASFPWEYMYIKDARGEDTYSGFLALNPRISIVRHEALPIPGDWAKATSRLRIVVAMATPQKHKTLTHLPEEQKALKKAFNEMAGISSVYLPEYTDNQPNNIPGATLEDLEDALIERTDIFHFSGHGKFEDSKAYVAGRRISEGRIILADGENKAVSVSGERLAEMLGGQGIRLVVLNACQTGQRDGYNVWSGVAAALLRAGIPAVVAMQYEIKDNLAAAFSGRFYRALVHGMIVDEAVAKGRAAIRNKALSDSDTPDIRDWGVPVLYLRAYGGRIFNPTKPSGHATERSTDGPRFKVFLSSTVRDLPNHREEAIQACYREKMDPVRMDHLPSVDAEAIDLSLKMVNDAHVYVGIFAHRYGYVPTDNNISIAEMEYHRAVERGIPRLIFLIHDDHLIKAADIERGRGALKLEDLKARLRQEDFVHFFKSPKELRAQIIQSLSPYRQADQQAFHYVSDIPKPPKPYIAHPYTLLQTKQIVGRQKELTALTDWAKKSEAPAFKCVVAIGGMGKSALTWKWFNDIAPQVMKPLSGRMWWSFYESDASFENFVIRALAYVSQRPKEDIERLSLSEREMQLFAILNRRPFLLVFDGLERLLIAYDRMDAARMTDDDLDEKTANFGATSLNWPESVSDSFVGKRQLRKTADPRVGRFLRKLVQVKKTRILVSTRLYPAELQTDTDQPIPGSSAYVLQGLEDHDALSLWRLFGVSGSDETLLPMFHTFENYPLLIRALAGQVSRYRRAPGNFDKWQQANPGFVPFDLPLVQVKSHVLAFALQGLNEKVRQVLHTIAAFRMPASYDTLAALLVGDRKPFSSEHLLDTALAELEDRGLLGWDRRANRYDLHPVVRGVAWAKLDAETKQGVFTTLASHFLAIPPVKTAKVKSLQDLTPSIELYHSLVNLGRYDDAFSIFLRRLHNPTVFRVGTVQRVDLLKMLLSEHGEKLPHLSRPDAQAFALNALGQGYTYTGRPERGASMYRRSVKLSTQHRKATKIDGVLCNLTEALCPSGALWEAERSARLALMMGRKQDDHLREAINLTLLGLPLAAREFGNDVSLIENRQNDQTSLNLSSSQAFSAFKRALRIYSTAPNYGRPERVTYAYLAQRALWIGDYVNAYPLANKAWKIANIHRFKRDIIRTAKLQGLAALGLGHSDLAKERLHYALIEARAENDVEDELPALIGLAELARRNGNLRLAHELLDDLWELAERGPYVLSHADARNVLAQIERDAGNSEAAIKAATQAYRLAWCDGPPYAYYCGLEKAKAHLTALGAPFPDMPPFDEPKHGRMPKVEIDPPDEFMMP